MMNNELFLRELEKDRLLIEEKLNEYLPVSNMKYAKLIESMRYTLLNGGKRIRGIICLKFCEAVCTTAEKALAAACAIEMLHAYTLIHDDLPCMDDDNMRRGKPANHIEYGEFTALLAGDAMQAYVFQTLLSADLPAETLVLMSQMMAETAGPNSVCAGQYLDLSSEGKILSEDELMEIYLHKTSSLITTAACLGILSGGGSQEQFDAAGQYSSALGLAFQVRDDILDYISTEDELGKPIGSDAENQKNTLVSLLGIEKCEKLCSKLTSHAIEVLDDNFENSEFLKTLAMYLVDRKN